MQYLILILVYTVSVAAWRPFRVNALSSRVLHSRSIMKGGTNSEEFAQWEKEEADLQKEVLRNKIDELRTDGETIPDYMMQMLGHFEQQGNAGPTHEAHLPIIAVIGRPNTGKSTIVNKLASSHKVRLLVSCKLK